MEEFIWGMNFITFKKAIACFYKTAILHVLHKTWCDRIISHNEEANNLTKRSVVKIHLVGGRLSRYEQGAFKSITSHYDSRHYPWVVRDYYSSAIYMYNSVAHFHLHIQHSYTQTYLYEQIWANKWSTQLKNNWPSHNVFFFDKRNHEAVKAKTTGVTTYRLITFLNSSQI